MDRPEPAAVFPELLSWESAGTSRIPFAAYTSEALHRRELERFFYRSHWCYVGLEAEIPNPGDFKRTVVGERSVLSGGSSRGTRTTKNADHRKSAAFRANTAAGVLTARKIPPRAGPTNIPTLAMVLPTRFAAVSSSGVLTREGRSAACAGEYELETTVDRREFGLNWQNALPSGADALAWDVTLTVDLQLVKQA